MTNTKSSHTLSTKLASATEALAFINEHAIKVPMEGLELSGISVYPHTVYDPETKKYDYSKQEYTVSISWRTPKSATVDPLDDLID